MAWFTSPQAWAALLTLTVLEVVLGIDNIVFITVLAGRLPPQLRARARTLGLAGAMLTRVALLFSIKALSTLTEPLFTVSGLEVAGRNLVFAAGGLFLLAKGTQEIHHRLEGDGGDVPAAARRPTPRLSAVVAQIMLIDVVFSLDSVVTAVGMAEHLTVMVAAVVAAVVMMMFAAGPIGAFVDRHPTVKMLALSFLLLIGLSLVAEALGQHIPKGFLYFAIGFSLFVELLNLRAARSRAATATPSPDPPSRP
ncbi:MAG TPA: TerC family protein [Trueperaceae bacterium]|nr:TerC family protein [Trueperaceae bacterium]